MHLYSSSYILVVVYCIMSYFFFLSKFTAYTCIFCVKSFSLFSMQQRILGPQWIICFHGEHGCSIVWLKGIWYCGKHWCQTHTFVVITCVSTCVPPFKRWIICKVGFQKASLWTNKVLSFMCTKLFQTRRGVHCISHQLEVSCIGP